MTAVIVGDRARLPNGYDLSMTDGVPNQMSARCFSGRAVALDGTGDYIKLDGFNFDSTGAWTIESWMKPETPGEARFWFAMGDSNELTCYYSTGAAGNIGFYPDGSLDAYGSALPFCDGTTWHHWCLSVGAGSSATAVLYIDGKQYATSTVTCADISSESKFRFAGDANGNSTLDGSITGIKVVVGTAYSAAQALEAYQVPEQPVPSGVTSSHLKSWLGCDYDVAGTNNLGGLYLQDASGNGNHGLMVNGTAEFSQPNIPQLGLRSSSSRCLFNDSNTVMRLSPSGTDIDCSGAFTYLFWFNTFSVNLDARLLDANAGAGPLVFIDSADSGYVRVRTKVDFGGSYHTWDTPNNAVPVGEWVHVGVTFAGGDSNEIVYYVNGSSVAVTNPTGTPSGTQGADSGIKDIGGTGASQVWDGLISEVAIFAGTQLSASAVAVAYNSGVQGFDLLSDSGDYSASGLDGWWKLDNPSSVKDLKGSTNGAWNNVPNMATIPEGTTSDLSVFGTLTNNRPSFAWSGGAGVNAYNDFSGNVFSLPDPGFGTANYTIAFWYRCAAYPGDNAKLVFTKSIDGSRFLDIFFQNNTTTRFSIQGSGGSGQKVDTSVTVTAAQQIGSWIQIVLRREAAATHSFVIHPLDASAVSTTDETSKTPANIDSDSAYGFRFGGGYDETHEYGAPSYAQFAFPRIWVGEAITDAQVNALYESGARMLRGT